MLRASESPPSYRQPEPQKQQHQAQNHNSFWAHLKSLTNDAFHEANSCLSPFNRTRFKTFFRSSTLSSGSTSASETELNHNNVKVANFPKQMDLTTTENNDNNRDQMNLKFETTAILERVDDANIKTHELNSQVVAITCDAQPKEGANFIPLSIRIPSSPTERSTSVSLPPTSKNRPSVTSASEEHIENYKPKRCSSLKPPRSCPESGSNSAKKAVRFANTFGIDLVHVKQIFNLDDPPEIPASALSDLHLDPDFFQDDYNDKKTSSLLPDQQSNRFEIRFRQPGSMLGFLDRVWRDTVALETAAVDIRRGMLTGLIRVLNKSFQKSVLVRISYNNWHSHVDIPATYIENSNDGRTDQFSFSVYLPASLGSGDVIQFAIKYGTPTGEEFWDNNLAENYKILCNEPNRF